MISPLAYIHPNAKIGNDVIIEPFAVVHDKVTIGDFSHIMSHAVINEFTTIGRHCRIFPGAVVQLGTGRGRTSEALGSVGPIAFPISALSVSITGVAFALSPCGSLRGGAQPERDLAWVDKAEAGPAQRQD